MPLPGSFDERFPRLGVSCAGPRRRKRRFGGKPRARPVGVERLLERYVTVNEPESKRVTDITGILTLEGKVYLCIVVDLYCKLIMGWSMHHRPDRHVVAGAVQIAAWQRLGCSEVIPYSDHGGQFISGAYQKFLGGNAPVCSMSAVGHGADNAACESIFGILKRERANHRQYRTRDEARADLFDCLERFHNPRVRRSVARQDRKFSALTHRRLGTHINELRTPKGRGAWASQSGRTGRRERARHGALTRFSSDDLLRVARISCLRGS